MASNDRVGNHGEFVFQALISRRCGKKFYFHPVHMGEKHPTTDMVVELLDADGVQSVFYVQVKSTALGYSPRGRPVSHGALPFVYHREVTQLALNFEDRTGGAAPWMTSLVSAA